MIEERLIVYGPNFDRIIVVLETTTIPKDASDELYAKFTDEHRSVPFFAFMLEHISTWTGYSPLTYLQKQTRVNYHTLLDWQKQCIVEAILTYEN